MTITVEDGSIVADANSYATVAQARAYCLARGVTANATDSVIEAELITAMDYLESQWSKYQGNQAYPGVQALQWPRQDVSLFGADFPTNAIPKQLRDAQCCLVMDIEVNGANYQKTLEPFVKSEKIGPIETVYSETVNTDWIQYGSPIMQAANALLEPLFKVGGFTLRSLRV